MAKLCTTDNCIWSPDIGTYKNECGKMKRGMLSIKRKDKQKNATIRLKTSLKILEKLKKKKKEIK